MGTVSGRLLLGVAGKARSGKDSAAAYLCRAHGFVRLGWADALRDEVARLLRAPLLAYAAEKRQFLGMAPEAILTVLLYGPERSPFVRALLQAWGTELRRAEDRHYWVRALAARIEDLPADASIIIPDTRFPNEAEAIRRWGGWLVKVERPGHDGGAGDHVSETSLDGWTDWDATFFNSGTIFDLEKQVEQWIVPLL